MSSPELLMTLAEVGVTMAALSAVAGVIESRRGEDPTNAINSRVLRDVAVIGLVAALFAVLPLIFDGPLGESIYVWRWFSAASFVVWVFLYVSFLRDASVAVRSRSIYLVDLLGGLVVTLLGLGLFASNVIMPSDSAPQRYTLGIVCLLAIAGMNFLGGAFGLRVRQPPAA